MSTNPYAAPAASPVYAAPDALAGASSYSEERRSVAPMIVLSIVTFGIYPTVWVIRRTPFLDSLHSVKKVGVLGWINLFLLLGYFGVTLVSGIAQGLGSIDSSIFDGIDRALQVVEGFFTLYVLFRVASILRSDFAQTRRSIHVSSVLVFFLGCLHLQHVMNRAADRPR